jgi:hypothetical protein
MDVYKSESVHEIEIMASLSPRMPDSHLQKKRKCPVWCGVGRGGEGRGGEAGGLRKRVGDGMGLPLFLKK